ncbi:major facilitator superfamily domain-containing protein [Chlamydoabsidia padenii]|nr:major facilitator superfamily domain-containing protein [Chlamydoabsidia padenii]
MYLFASLDRSNIGNARLGSFEEDLHLKGNDFYNALMVFFIGYMACQIPSNLVLKLITPSLWIGTTAIIWGASSTSIAATYNLTGLMLARFFLGCAEAGLGPCIPLLLSFWYQRHEMASRISVFLAASTLAGSFAGIWAYVIMDNMDHFLGLASWRWMFIIEGTPTILLGVFCLFFLPNYPETASKYWLKPDEKQLAIQRGVAEGKSETDNTVNSQEIIGALLDYKTWVVAVINGGMIMCHSSFSIFLPTIVKAMGFQALQSQLLSVPPYVFGCITLLGVCRYSDHVRQRGLPIISCSILTVLGYTFLLIGNNIILQYIGVILVSCGINPTISLGISWLSNNQLGHTRRGVSLSAANMLSQVFGLIGTQIYRENDSPNYRLGHTICLLFTLLSILLACLLRYLLARENKRRDTVYGSLKKMNWEKDGNEMDMAQFRYML